MAWRLANSLVVLRTEINTIAPNRSKLSDGTIGDEAHQGTGSDHNPNDAGVVCAIDFTHDPANDADMHQFAEHIRRRRHIAVKYVIWNRRIWSKARDGEGWRAYYGKNPHTKHMHVSAGVGSDGDSTGPYDDLSPWGIADIGDATDRVPSPTLRPGDSGWDVELLQRALSTALGLSLSVDGDFGPATTSAVQELQRRAGLTADGIYGSATAGALRDLLEDNDMQLSDKIGTTDWTEDKWGVTSLTVSKALSDSYTYSRNSSDNSAALLRQQAAQGALLNKILAASGGLTEAEVAAAVAEGVRQAIPPVEEIAAAVAAAVDHDLDTAAVTAALREVLGSVDEAGE